MKFKDKEYQLKQLFIRDEAALAKQMVRLGNEDLEVKADAMVEACHILVGVDKGDLNGSSLAEVSQLMREILAERARIAAEKAASEGAKEAPTGE